jgi:hypothetical protein
VSLSGERLNEGTGRVAVIEEIAVLVVAANESIASARFSRSVLPDLSTHSEAL